MSKLTIDLESQVREYAEQKAQLDALKKWCDSESKEIKETMQELDLDKIDAGDYVATCTVSNRETMNESHLLDIIERSELNVDGLIKTKEYVDFDVLERAIYNNQIPQDILLEMDKAREVKEVVTLRVTKKKRKTND